MRRAKEKNTIFSSDDYQSRIIIIDTLISSCRLRWNIREREESEVDVKNKIEELGKLLRR